MPAPVCHLFRDQVVDDGVRHWIGLVTGGCKVEQCIIQRVHRTSSVKPEQQVVIPAGECRLGRGQVFLQSGFVCRKAVRLCILRGERRYILRVTGHTTTSLHKRVAHVLKQMQASRGGGSCGYVSLVFHLHQSCCFLLLATGGSSLITFGTEYLAAHSTTVSPIRLFALLFNC